MSLLDQSSYKCAMIDRTTTSDGYGGIVDVWVEGASFDAAIALDDSIQAQTALAMGAIGVYTVVTKKTVNLRYHDVFRRKSDGKVFRVVTDGDDKKTPPSAGLNMRVVRAEEWAITGEEEQPKETTDE